MKVSAKGGFTVYPKNHLRVNGTGPRYIAALGKYILKILSIDKPNLMSTNIFCSYIFYCIALYFFLAQKNVLVLIILPLPEKCRPRRVPILLPALRVNGNLLLRRARGTDNCNFTIHVGNRRLHFSVVATRRGSCL